MHDERDARREALLKASNEAAGVARTLYLAMLGTSAFVAIIAGGLTDEKLFRNSAVPLPLIEKADLPLSSFFAVAPWLVVFLHTELLMHLAMLARKVAGFEDALHGLIRSEVSSWRARLSNFPFAHWLLPADGTNPMRNLQGLVAWTTVVLLPVVTLVYAQLAFLPFQDAGITWAQRLAVISDLGLLLYLWPNVMGPGIARLAWWRKAVARLTRVDLPETAAPRRWRLAVFGQGAFRLLSVGAAALYLSLLAAVIPLEPWELFLLRLNSSLGGHNVWQRSDLPGNGDMVVLPSTHALQAMSTFQLRRTLKIDSAALVQAASPEVLSLARNKDLETRVQAIERISGLDLQGRSLRYARLQSVGLFKADLRRADLTGAFLNTVQLHGADLRGAHLTGARIADSSLTETKLSQTRMIGVRLVRSDLSGSDLTGANLTGAHVGFDVGLEQTCLKDVVWRSALLRKVRLGSALVVEGAPFEGAVLSDVQAGSAFQEESASQPRFLVLDRVTTLAATNANPERNCPSAVLLRGGRYASLFSNLAPRSWKEAKPCVLVEGLCRSPSDPAVLARYFRATAQTACALKEPAEFRAFVQALRTTAAWPIGVSGAPLIGPPKALIDAKSKLELELVLDSCTGFKDSGLSEIRLDLLTAVLGILG